MLRERIIIGLDEAGRGPLAGPIVGAAVLVEPGKQSEKILRLAKDSKTLTPRQRQYIFSLITENLPWAVYAADNNFIDQRGIQAANVLVLEKSLGQLLVGGIKNYRIVSDFVGAAKNYLTIEEKIIFYKHGESKFKSIAAASIIAKVCRDQLMLDLHGLYPQYNFIQHKGYATAQHIAMIKKHGPSPVHRQSFLSNYFSYFEK